MSLTDEYEINELFKKPTRENHNPHFMGDKKTCDYSTGHCSNTSACNDCKLYDSVMRIRDYESNFKDDKE